MDDRGWEVVDDGLRDQVDEMMRGWRRQHRRRLRRGGFAMG